MHSLHLDTNNIFLYKIFLQKQQSQDKFQDLKVFLAHIPSFCPSLILVMGGGKRKADDQVNRKMLGLGTNTFANNTPVQLTRICKKEGRRIPKKKVCVVSKRYTTV